MRLAIHSMMAILLVAGCSSPELQGTRWRCATQADCGDGLVCNSQGYCGQSESECSTTAECAASVGFGAVCESGMCIDVTPIDRCTKTYPADLWQNLSSYRDSVVFGALMDRSSTVHEARENGMESAALVVNEASSLPESDYGIIFCDIHGGPENPYDALQRPDAAVSAANWLVNTLEVPGIIGVAWSGDTQKVYVEVVQPNIPKTVLLSPSASSPGLTDLDTNEATDNAPGFLWRTASSAGSQAPVLANDMASRSITKVAVIRERGAFGEGIAAPFIEDWIARGNDFTAEQYVFDDGNASQRSDEITRAGIALTSTAIEAVLFIAQTADSQAFLAQATNDPNYADGIPLYFPETGANPSLFADTGGNNRLFEEVRATRQSVAINSFPYATFAARFMARFDADPADFTFTAHAYDAMWMLSLATVWAQGQAMPINGRSVAQGLRRLSGGSVEVPFTSAGWGTAIVNLRQGSRIDVQGASSELDYDLRTEEQPGGVELLQGQLDGSLTLCVDFMCAP